MLDCNSTDGCLYTRYPSSSSVTTRALHNRKPLKLEGERSREAVKGKSTTVERGRGDGSAWLNITSLERTTGSCSPTLCNISAYSRGKRNNDGGVDAQAFGVT